MADTDQDTVKLSGPGGNGDAQYDTAPLQRDIKVMPAKLYDSGLDTEVLRELQSTRNYQGLKPDQRLELEDWIKSRYEIDRNWVDPLSDGNFGYKIHDNQTNEDIYFSANSRLTLETRYLEKDVRRDVTENGLDLFARVAANVAEADLKYDSNADVEATATEFLEMMIHQEFIPNTPTLCNAGRSLQQLSACFVLPVGDYMATDDIGDDPEKQGEGIYDTLRNMAMIHKSGGGTGFNFGHLRPRSDRISTTFGSSSGPVSFIKVYDASTDAVNQGGFRRGANMGILPVYHPDIFEFASEKARNHNLVNFNLSVGYDNAFMEAVKSGGYITLVNPKGEADLPPEQRIWKKENLLVRGEDNFDKLYTELAPSLVVDEDGKTVLNTYNNDAVGLVSADGNVMINAKSLFDYIVHNAWADGCPGMINLERLESNNKTPHVGRIDATNPCGEQPLLSYEACNLGGINAKKFVVDGKLDHDRLEERVATAMHFLDNVIDMSKFPFQKIYGMVHGNRKVGLGYLGVAETLVELGLQYGSDDAVDWAKDFSTFMTESARKASQDLARTRGVFPFWKGSVYESSGTRVRNATATTVAPNGTTGMIIDANGGIEPFFNNGFVKTCMDGKELTYYAPGLVDRLRIDFNGDEDKLEKAKAHLREKGSLEGLEDVSDETRKLYVTSHQVTPEDHVKMQAAFQNGKDGIGVDNAVSKTVNLPNEATPEDVARIMMLSYELGCVGTTIFRDGSKTGVYSSGDGNNGIVKLIQNHVETSPVLDIRSQAIKYKIKRPANDDTLHITFTSDLFVDDENSKAYFLPTEAFHNRAPLGHHTSVSFAQSGMDRTEIFKGEDPDYAQMVTRLQSASSNQEEGIGPNRIKSVQHACGIAMEDYLMRNGIVSRDAESGQLVNNVRKRNLRQVDTGSEEYEELMRQVRARSDDETLHVYGNGGKLAEKFECPQCGGTKYTYEQGCHAPKCKSCGHSDGCN